MSAMGDSTVNEVKALADYVIKILSSLIQLLAKMEQHHHERVIHDKSFTHKLGKAGIGVLGFAGGAAAKEFKKRFLSGQIDLKKYNKMQKHTNFKDIKVPTVKLPEIMESAKKAGIPLFSCNMGNNISLIACPQEHEAALDKIMKMMISKECERDMAYEFNINAEFSGDNKILLHNILDSYDIPATTFVKEDGTELIAVPAKYQDKYLDAYAEAKEKVKDIENIEITDFTNDGFIWDDPNTTAIEVTPLQAKYLDEYNKNIKIVDVDGKLYAYGKNIEQDVKNVIDEDNSIEKSSNEWQIAIVDNTITLNKDKLFGKDEGTTQLIKLPGEADTYIRFDKAELVETDGGKTVASKLEYDRNYDICDASGSVKEIRNGSKLADNFSTRSPLSKLLNDSTDKSMYNNTIDRIELYNEKTNKLVSIPITDKESVKRSLINKVGVDERTADRMAERISAKITDEYKQKFGYINEKIYDYTAGKTTINAVKAAILAQKLKGYKCQNNSNENIQGDVFAIMDKRSQEYVLVSKDKWYQVDDKLKEMGYLSVERAAVISKLKQTYNINGEIESSSNFGQTITTTEPALENVRFSDLGNGITTIFNLEDTKLNYVTIDKDITTLELEQLCSEKLKIKDDRAIAEMAEIFKDRTKGLVEMGKDNIDGRSYKFSQLTSKYLQISDGVNSVTVNKNILNTEKLAKQLGISEKSAEKIIKKINESFKAKSEMKKGITPLSKLKSEAERIFTQNKEKTVGEKGQTKSEKVQTTERSK